MKKIHVLIEKVSDYEDETIKTNILATTKDKFGSSELAQAIRNELSERIDALTEEDPDDAEEMVKALSAGGDYGLYDDEYYWEEVCVV